MNNFLVVHERGRGYFLVAREELRLIVHFEAATLI